MTFPDPPAEPEIVLTAEQWRRIQAMARAAEHLEPDTGDSDPPTWENQ